MKYNIILADPPWQYNNRANHKTRFRGGACGHYDLMTLSEIMALAVGELAADRALLYLWCTFPYQYTAPRLAPDGTLIHKPGQLDCMAAWGFTYKTVGFLWEKTNRLNNDPFFGVGFYSKSNAEPCYLGTHGKPLKPVVDDVSSLIRAPIARHSRKPDEVYRRIDRMYPGLSKIELFATQCWPGWDATGLQYDGLDIREAIEIYKRK